MLPLKDQPKSGETARGFIGAPVPVLVIGVEITGGTSNRNSEYPKAAGAPFGSRLHAYFLIKSYLMLTSYRHEIKDLFPFLQRSNSLTHSLFTLD
jgi:hypothetical protein